MFYPASSEIKSSLNSLAKNLDSASSNDKNGIEKVWHFGSSFKNSCASNDIDIAMTCVNAKSRGHVRRMLEKTFPDGRIQNAETYTRGPVRGRRGLHFHFVLLLDHVGGKQLPIRKSIESGLCIWENRIASTRDRKH